MLRTHLLLSIGVNTLLRGSERRSGYHIEIENDHPFTLLCPKRTISQFRETVFTQKRRSSNAPAFETHIDRSWRRNFLGFIIIVVTVASIVYTMTSAASEFRESEEFLVFKVIEVAPEIGRNVRMKAKVHLSTSDQGQKRILRALLTNGHVKVTEIREKSSYNAVIVGWEVDRSTAIVTCLVEGNLSETKESQIEVRCHRGFVVRNFQSIPQSDDSKSAPVVKYGFQQSRHMYSFIKLPKHVDRVVLISSAADIPKLYPIFCRLTGYSSAGVADETNLSGEAKAAERQSVLWIIEADSPQEIPLLKELLHVSKGSNFFDFYVTAKSGLWKWPSGIGTLNEHVLRRILPREIIKEEPNHVPMVPMISSKFSTGFVLTENIATRLLDADCGDLLKLLPVRFDKERSIAIVA